MIVYSDEVKNELIEAIDENSIEKLDFSICHGTYSDIFRNLYNNPLNSWPPLTYQDIAQVLEKMLVSHNQIKMLSLKNVQLGKEGFYFVMRLLESHQHLEHLDLTQTGLTPDQKELLHWAINEFNQRTGRYLSVTGVFESPLNNNNNSNNIIYNEDSQSESLNQQEENILAPSQNFSFSTPWRSPPVDKLDEKAIENFLCSISGQIMYEPVSTEFGDSYEKEKIEHWLKTHNNNPLDNQKLNTKTLTPNRSLRSIIRDFLDKNPAYWEEVYIPEGLAAELLQLSSTLPINLPRWREILQAHPGLLTGQLSQGQIVTTLFDHLCQQKQEIVEKLLPELLERLKPADWIKLTQEQSVQDRLQQVIQACGNSHDTVTIFIQSLQKGLNISIDSKEVLSYAQAEKNETLFQFALSQLGNINQRRDKEQNTLLHMAARTGDLWLIHQLTRRGCNLRPKNKAGLTPKGLARETGYDPAVNFISLVKATSVLKRNGLFPDVIASTEKKQRELVETQIKKGIAPPHKPNVRSQMK
ncbi:MAG: hypothetical protein HKM04_01110 [Legionellales bacterium]|nr:hypothetical protein [Legionellales bacterium]